ncbi:MAG: competence/damage-inducible protein A [Alphaproteobacteria bacterium]|nr:competence/damage-inducible protein A [Alphaproteobacteria bacterium]
MTEANKVTACLIIIGNEILSGRTQDANLAYLAKWLNDQVGIQLTEVRVIPDIEETIVDTVNECRARFDYVFTTGGIGPTHDDITSPSIAKAFGVPWELHPEAHEILKEYYGPEGLTSARARMACGPRGARLIENPISKAPGFQMENVFVLAGIPVIMQAMLESLKHRLTGGLPVRSRAVLLHLPESLVASGLRDLQERHPQADIGSYPFYRQGRGGTSIVIRSTDEELNATLAEEVFRMAFELGGDPQFEESA